MLAMEPILVLVTIYVSIVYGLLYARTPPLPAFFFQYTHLLFSLPSLPDCVHCSPPLYNLPDRSHFYWHWHWHYYRFYHQLVHYSQIQSTYCEMARISACRREVDRSNDWCTYACDWCVLVGVDRRVRECTVVCCGTQYDRSWGRDQFDFHELFELSGGYVSVSLVVDCVNLVVIKTNVFSIRMYSASAFAANTFCRSAVAAAFPLFTVQMFTTVCRCIFLAFSTLSLTTSHFSSNSWV